LFDFIQFVVFKSRCSHTTRSREFIIVYDTKIASGLSLCTVSIRDVHRWTIVTSLQQYYYCMLHSVMLYCSVFYCVILRYLFSTRH